LFVAFLADDAVQEGGAASPDYGTILAKNFARSLVKYG
jgi:hypothetical protein